ncbi:hypothetical protein C0992_012838, partial [Termitomyces sp. T32_za158]
MLSLSEVHTTSEEPEPEPQTESESDVGTTAGSEDVFDTSISFAGVYGSPAVRRNIKETAETSFVDIDSLTHLVPSPTDEELDWIEDEAVVGVGEQSQMSVGEKSMEIDSEDHSNIYDLETGPLELTPRPTPVFTFTGIGKNNVSEGHQTILDRLAPASADDSVVSVGNQTVFDPE